MVAVYMPNALPDDDGSSSSGWNSDMNTFYRSPSGDIQLSLENFVRDFSREQAGAWREEIRLLQREAGELLQVRDKSAAYGTILEYRLPYDDRRPDVVVLAEGAIVVLELKGKDRHTRADLDQTAAYARDLRAYHRECHQRPVHAILVPTHAKGLREVVDGVLVVAPDLLDQVVAELAAQAGSSGPDLGQFLHEDSYCPLPTLVEAARELFESRTVREIWRARASTEPAVEAIQAITNEAARTQTRHLVLVSGVPGAGKTLVGMRAVHARYLDDLAVTRERGKPAVPGLYLTGNGPLAEVLQYELKRAGGGGTAFVRHIKSYLDRYVSHPTLVPPEHLLVFDEAQRAFSADKVADTHPQWPIQLVASEPELFVRICDRMPEWAVLVGLIGGGQEIHVGEEEGLGQWREAIEHSANPWVVHGSPETIGVFMGSSRVVRATPSLDLNTEIRFHGTVNLHHVVETLLGNGGPEQMAPLLNQVLAPNGVPFDGIKLYITRDLHAAKAYLTERYAEHPKARFGMLASSRDRALVSHGVDNSFQGTKNVKIGPWFTQGEDGEHSCRHLRRCVTEFQCQGLELDMALVAWGTDFIRVNGQWSHQYASRYRTKGRVVVRSPFQIRRNAYRVLLTRGRDGSVIYLPRHAHLDETWDFMQAAGFTQL